MLRLLIFLNCYRKVADCENYGKDYKEPMAKKNSAKGKNKNANRRKSDCFFETRFFKEKNINKNVCKKQNSVSGKIDYHFFGRFKTEFPDSEREHHKEH